MLWLIDELKQEVRKVFEPRYNRNLNDDDVSEIAENLTNALEAFFKTRWRIYENSKTNH